jgi:hypothetical protein
VTSDDVALARAWEQQSVWSQVAGRLKRELQRSRIRVLTLTVIGAVLSAAAVVAGLDSGAGKVLAALGGAAMGLAALDRARLGKDAVQRWTRARSVAEELKSEVYLYLTGVDADPKRLEEQIDALADDAADLAPLKAGVTPRARGLPAVRDVESYVRDRLVVQIETYYRPKAAELQQKSDRIRAAQQWLAGVGVVAAAAAAIWETDSVAVWVPVLTTIGAALAAYGAAERYDFQVVEFLRTADQLERLRDRRGSAASMSDEELVRAAEQVISIQNDGWMAKLSSDPEN